MSKKQFEFSVHTTSGYTINFVRFNNNWRRYHGLPALRRLGKYRWETIREV